MDTPEQKILTRYNRGVNRLALLCLLFLAACAPAAAPAPALPTAVLAASPTATASSTPTPPASPTAPPTASPTPLTCWNQGGQTFADFIPSAVLPQPLEFQVYLPPCYEAEPERRYPVLYLIHGQSFTHDQWKRLGAPATVDQLVASGDLPPFIIVMPRDRVWTQPSEDFFGQAVMQELLPYIDATYRTQPERQYRAIGGLSRGASWALHLGLGQWESFSAIGLHSLPVFWEDVPRLRGWLAEIPLEELPRIYIDIGERDREEILNSTFYFRDLLDELAIPHEYNLFTGRHEEAYWASHVEKYLRFYAAEWGEE